MSNPFDPDRYPEVLQDVEICAKAMPGKGAAFRRLRLRGGLTQKQVATALGMDRTVLTHWEAEKHWPPPENLRKALTHIGIDSAVMLKFFGVTLYGDRADQALKAQVCPTTAALTLAEIILKESDADEIQRQIHNAMDKLVLAALVLKALSGDVRAIEAYFARSDRYAESSPRQRPSQSSPEAFLQVRREVGAILGPDAHDVKMTKGHTA
jgi:transcriptional regulator with XRE-family HTH domain